MGKRVSQKEKFTKLWFICEIKTNSCKVYSTLLEGKWRSRLITTQLDKYLSGHYCVLSISRWGCGEANAETTQSSWDPPFFC